MGVSANQPDHLSEVTLPFQLTRKTDEGVLPKFNILNPNWRSGMITKSLIRFSIRFRDNLDVAGRSDVK